MWRSQRSRPARGISLTGGEGRGFLPGSIHIHLRLTGKQRGRKLTICQGQDGTQIEFSSWPLKMLTFSSAHHFHMSYFHNLLNTLNNCLRPKG